MQTTFWLENLKGKGSLGGLGVDVEKSLNISDGNCI
jgi:hypothetical protein